MTIQPARILTIDDEATAIVAHPDVIERHREELDVGGAAPLLGQTQLVGSAEHRHRLILSNGLGQQGNAVIDRGSPVFPD